MAIVTLIYSIRRRMTMNVGKKSINYRNRVYYNILKAGTPMPVLL